MGPIAEDTGEDLVDLTGAFVIEIENDVPIASGDTETAFGQEDDTHNLQTDGNGGDGNLSDAQATVTGRPNGSAPRSA